MAFAAVPDPRAPGRPAPPLGGGAGLVNRRDAERGAELVRHRPMGAAPAAGGGRGAGFRRDQTPQRRDAAPDLQGAGCGVAFEAALAQWAQGQVGDALGDRRAGQAPCGGSTAKSCLGCGWWPPTAIGPPGAGPSGVRTAEHEAELTVAPAVLEAFRLERRLVTGDALYCQRALCRTLVARGGAYFFAVKANQPSLHDDLFGCSHGQSRRALRRGGGAPPARRSDRDPPPLVSAALADYADWPGLRQVCKIERQVVCRGKTSVETAYAVTSLGPGGGTRPTLAIWRGHWAIENWPLRARRDLRRGRFPGPQRGCPEVLAALRNVVLRLLRQAATPTSRLHSSSSPGSLALPSVCSASTRHHNEKTLGTRAMGPRCSPSDCRKSRTPPATQLGIVTKA